MAIIASFLINVLAWTVQNRVITVIEKKHRKNLHAKKSEMYLWYGWLIGLLLRSFGLVLFIGLIQFSSFGRMFCFIEENNLGNLKANMVIAYLIVYWIVLSLDLALIVRQKNKTE